MVSFYTCTYSVPFDLGRGYLWIELQYISVISEGNMSVQIKSRFVRTKKSSGCQVHRHEQAEKPSCGN
jgi:hypothetical protein